MVEYIRQNYGTDDLVVVSPDAGGAKRYALKRQHFYSPN